MTYEESAALMGDIEFRGRIKVAVLKYADSILIEPTSTPAHNTRTRWAITAINGPDMVAQQVQPPTVMDPAIQSAGAAIEDVALQGSVEAVINKQF